MTRLDTTFYRRDVLEVAPELIGKKLVRQWPEGQITEHLITETEAYRGTEDLACHASKGLTPRTRMMYEPGGVLYMYLVYGMHWMLNIVTAHDGEPQAALIRATETVSGPGRLTRHLALDKTFNGEDLLTSARIWVTDNGFRPEYTSHPRIGIDYAGDPWKNKPWRYTLYRSP